MRRRSLLTLLLTSAAAAAIRPRSAEAATDGLAAIKARGKLIAGVKLDTPPFGFLDADDKPVGFDLDIVRLIAQRIGVPVEFTRVTSPTRIPMLVSGNVDLVAASMTNTPERAQVIDFSITYYTGGQSLLVPDGSPITGVGDLAGKTVSVQQGTTLQQTITKLAPKAEVLAFKDYNSAWLALQQRRADAFTGSLTILQAFAKQNAGYRLVGGLFSTEPFGIGVQKGNQTLLDAVNATIRDAATSGRYATLYAQWFGGTPPVPIDTHG